MVNMLEITDLSDKGFPIRLPRSIRINSTKTAAEVICQPTITSKELNDDLTEVTGVTSEKFTFSTRVYEFDLQDGDHVIVRETDKNLPLIVVREKEIIVNFDIWATQAFQFDDSKRPIYTYIPGFNIQMIPEGIRRTYIKLCSIDAFLQWTNMLLTNTDGYR